MVDGVIYLFVPLTNQMTRLETSKLDGKFPMLCSSIVVRFQKHIISLSFNNLKNLNIHFNENVRSKTYIFH